MKNLYTIPRLAQKLGVAKNTIIDWYSSKEIEPLYTVGALTTGGREMPLFDYDQVVISKCWAKYVALKDIHKKKGRPVDKSNRQV